MKPVLPVILEQYIAKVTDSKTHPNNRQHYAATLSNIIDEAQEALKIYEAHRKNFK